ncbi:MAG: hypothetical protein BRC29_00955 [Nanohaloarchaea archaeon SW_7_43_1]|nr:MAG: hypothetical protein BRC29_00955 [Nanohaloarchaea archaeon SW_7_43_1]
MLSRLKVPLSIGFAFYGIAYLAVRQLGYNSTSFMVISYLYIALAGILGIKYEIKRMNKSDSLLSIFKNIVIIQEDEEMVMKRLFTREKYKLRGEIEKL